MHIPEGPTLDETMLEIAEAKEIQHRYEHHISVLLKRARVCLDRIDGFVESREEHWRVETTVDQACEALGAVETGYQLLLDELAG